MAAYTPHTGAKCSCRRGVQRDNCSTCEGTGFVIDFRAIHDRRRREEEARKSVDDSRKNPSAYSGSYGPPDHIPVKDLRVGDLVLHNPRLPVSGYSFRPGRGASAGSDWYRIEAIHPGGGDIRFELCKIGGTKIFTDVVSEKGVAYARRGSRRNPKGAAGWKKAERGAYERGDWRVVKQDSGKWEIHHRVGGSWNYVARRPTMEIAIVWAELMHDGHDRRSNPYLGMPGDPHTWVTHGGHHLSAGDTVEYWGTTGLPRGAKPEKRRSRVLRYLIFHDHVQVDHGWAGETVDDSNFIRVVRKAQS